VYNTLGQQMALQQTQQLPGGTTSAYTRVFDYDGEGEILGRTDGTLGGGTFTALSGATTAQPDALPPQHLAYVGSASVATLSTDGLISLSDGLVQPALSAGSADQYTVQAGDTLQSIAQTVYGNASLWYVIADANALSVDSSGNAIDLVAGTTLKLPAVSNQNSKTGVSVHFPLRTPTFLACRFWLARPAAAVGLRSPPGSDRSPRQRTLRVIER
jgi:hypothetical protein